ncbi:thioesterase [Pseudonocardiaceae bacterium YIM PH 21723]|nr:thioesterase [Pseudonocardiaceae bacterium YIM PH 21723]
MRRFSPAPEAPVRLVCLPHAGGSASFYRPLALGLAPGVEALMIQYPGRQDRLNEPGETNLPRLAERVHRELLPYLDRPLALFGHSMGAIVAFELARRLQAAGTPARELFASAHRAPHLRSGEPAIALIDQELINRMTDLDGTDPRVLADPEIREMVLPAMRADYQALESYRFADGEPLTCPITVLTGTSDPRVTPDEAVAWKQHGAAGVEVHEFDGGHFYLVAQAKPVTALLAERLA